MAKSPLFRKITRVNLSLKRLVSRKGNNKAVLINSFPKSGTHLLSQIFESGQLVQDYGYFLNNASSFRFREKPEYKVLKNVSSIKDGELVRGHLWYTEAIGSLLESKDVASYFIYRDLRDVVISEAFYLSKLNRWHALHKYFSPLKGDMNKAIELSILGLPNGGPTGLYRNIGERFFPFMEWISSPEICAVKFENLICKETQVKVVKDILDFYFMRKDYSEDYLNTALQSLVPENSHTFRSGKKEQWKTVFTKRHKKLFKEVAGSYLIDLGFEGSNSW